MTALSAEYPDVELSHMYVDNAAMQLIRNPKQVLPLLSAFHLTSSTLTHFVMFERIRIYYKDAQDILRK